MIRAVSAAARIGAAAVLAGALTGIVGPASPASADEAKPNLSVSFDSDPVAEINNAGHTLGMYVYNYGQAPATAVTVKLDLSAVSDQVEYSVPDYGSSCELAAAVVTCQAGVLQVDQVDRLYPLTLASKQGAKPGDAGEVVVTITSAEGAPPEGNTTTFPVTIVASGPDLVALATDLNTAADPVGPGDQAPIHAAVVNEGDTDAPGVAITVDLPAGAVFAERYTDCTYKSFYRKDGSDGYAYNPSAVTCVLPIPLAAGEELLFFDEQTGESVFNAVFGKNLAGPMETSGTFEVALADEEEVTAAQRRAGGGQSLLKKVTALQERAAKRGKAKIQAALEELDTDDNFVEFSVFTKPNTLDVSVTAKPVTGSVGDTVTVTYEVVNNGPSDGSGPGVVITAPTGTVLLPAEWCYTDGTPGEQRPESTKLQCNFESFFPTNKSGYESVKASVRVKIKATPGTNGTIVVNGAGPSTESNPANNTVRIVIGSGGGGGGEGLPITGTPVGLIAGAGAVAVALGALFFGLSRRRRVVLVTPSSDS